MSLLSYLFLLLIGPIVAAVLHHGFRYRSPESLDAGFTKVAMGWLPAWLGSPVPGHWSCKCENVYVIPGIKAWKLNASEGTIAASGKPPRGGSSGVNRLNWNCRRSMSG